MPMKPNEREYRDFSLALVAIEPEGEAEEKIVRGYASTFDEPYTLYSDNEVEIREQVAKTAFNNADMSDVILQYDHEGRVFARMSNGTLKVMIKDYISRPIYPVPISVDSFSRRSRAGIQRK